MKTRSKKSCYRSQKQSWRLSEMLKKVPDSGVNCHFFQSWSDYLPETEAPLSSLVSFTLRNAGVLPKFLSLAPRHNYNQSENFPEFNGSHLSDRLRNTKVFSLKTTMLSTSLMLCKWLDNVRTGTVWGNYKIVTGHGITGGKESAWGKLLNQSFFFSPFTVALHFH